MDLERFRGHYDSSPSTKLNFICRKQVIGYGESTMIETEKATFGAGCFWCVEALFEQLDGVQSVVAGYAGGTVEHPTYEQVCTGTTGHTEVAQVTYDPAIITYEHLLEVFWHAHDPTTLHRQGSDVGTQYRSVIFYHGQEQRLAAERSIHEVQKEFVASIVSEIKPLTNFYEAEDYQQDYYRHHPHAPYCVHVIRPKLKKLLKSRSYSSELCFTDGVETRLLRN
jgi:peptide-methionine (S)-S-oxide reductase